jgi:predicted Zn-dependent peptidase
VKTASVTTAASLDAITRDDLLAVHAGLLHPANLAVSVSGKFERKAMVMKHVLGGGGFAARLMKKIRSDEGLTGWPEGRWVDYREKVKAVTAADFQKMAKKLPLSKLPLRDPLTPKPIP